MAAPDMGHVTPYTLRDRAARRLRDEIKSGILRPNEVLEDVELAQRLDINTTPFAKRFRNSRSSALSSCRPIALSASHPSRSATRSKCTRSFGCLPPKRRDRDSRPRRQLRCGAHEASAVAIARSDRHATVAASRSFHDRVIKAAGNGALRRTCARSFVWLERAFYSAADVDRADAAFTFEAAALDALERGDYAAANGALLAAIDGFATVLETLPEDSAVTAEPPLRAPLR